MATKIRFDADGQCSWCRCMLIIAAEIVKDTHGRQYCRDTHMETHHRYLARKALESGYDSLDLPEDERPL